MVARTVNLHHLKKRNELFELRFPCKCENIVHHHGSSTQI